MSATGTIPGDQTPGDRMDESERTVLLVLFHDPFPWTVEELGRELRDQGDAIDAVGRLAGAGLCIGSEISCSRPAPPGARMSSTRERCSRPSKVILDRSYCGCACHGADEGCSISIGRRRREELARPPEPGRCSGSPCWLSFR